jgi:hypothetical protein
LGFAEYMLRFPSAVPAREIGHQTMHLLTAFWNCAAFAFVAECNSDTPMGGTTHTTTRNRVIAVGERIDEGIRNEIAEKRKRDKPAKQMVIGLDGAFVKGRRPTDRASLEIVTAGSKRTLSQAKCSRSSGTRMATPNNTFRRFCDRQDEAVRPKCAFSRMVRRA